MSYRIVDKYDSPNIVDKLRYAAVHLSLVDFMGLCNSDNTALFSSRDIYFSKKSGL